MFVPLGCHHCVLLFTLHCVSAHHPWLITVDLAALCRVSAMLFGTVLAFHNGQWFSQWAVLPHGLQMQAHSLCERHRLHQQLLQNVQIRGRFQGLPWQVGVAISYGVLFS